VIIARTVEEHRRNRVAKRIAVQIIKGRGR
jgi:hypothetical protein